MPLEPAAPEAAFCTVPTGSAASSWAVLGLILKANEGFHLNLQRDRPGPKDAREQAEARRSDARPSCEGGMQKRLPCELAEASAPPTPSSARRSMPRAHMYPG